MNKQTFTNPWSHLYAALTGGVMGGVLFLFLRMPVLLAVVAGVVGYLISLLLLFPARQHPQTKPVTQGARDDDEGEHTAPWTPRHLALLVFLGTLIGSLLGALGSLSEIVNGLFVPTWKALHPSPVIRIVGSDTILGSRLGMADQWRADFQAINASYDSVPVVGRIERMYNVQIDAVGSLRGIQEAQRGAGNVHVLAASEPIPDADVQRMTDNGITFQCAGEIGYDLIVFVTAKHHDITVLSKEELHQILTGQVRDWSDVWPERDVRRQLPITIFARKGSGTTDVVVSAFTGSHDFPAHFVECSSNAECLNQALATPGSLYWVSLSWLYMQPFDYLQLMLIKSSEAEPPTNPLDENFNPNWYPQQLIRPLYLYVLKGPKTDPTSLAVAQEFFQYVRGIHGQKILEQHHFDTYFNPSSAMYLKLPPGFGRQPDGSRVVCR